MTTVITLCIILILSLVSTKGSPNDSLILLDRSNVPSCSSSTQWGPNSICSIINENLATGWYITGNDSLTVKFFNGSSVVNRIVLHHDIFVTSGLSITITLRGSDVTWITEIVNDCAGISSTTSTNHSVYHNCIEYPEISHRGTFEILQDGQFSYGLSNGSLVWWETFTEIQMDFYLDSKNSDTDNFYLKELQIFGWNEPNKECNCHPIGVRDLNSPCSRTGQCQCNLASQYGDNQHCVPFFKALIQQAPVVGGTEVRFETSFNTITEIEITIGDRYPCKIPTWDPDTSSTRTLTCKASPADSTVIDKSLPIFVCWVTTIYGSICRRLSERFQYWPNPEFTNIENRRAFKFGGIRQTVAGRNFISTLQASLVIAVYNISSRAITRFETDDKGNRHMCEVTSRTQMICFTPVVNEEVSCENPFSPAERCYFEIALFNGKYRDASNFNDSERNSYQVLELVDRIKFKPFGPSGIKKYDPLESSRLLDIDTEDETQTLLRGATMEDYSINSITVGGVPARLINVHSINSLNFQPPLNNTPPYVVAHQGLANVKLLIGYWEFDIGQIQYVDSMLPESKNEDSKVGLIVGLCLGCGALLAVILAVFCVIRLRRKRRKINGTDSWVKPSARESTMPPIKLHQSALEFVSLLPDEIRNKVPMRLIDSNRLCFDKPIGKGNFGRVYKGTLIHKNGTTEIVAIKTLIECNQETNFSKKVEFLKEAVIMIEFSHRNVLALIGIALDSECMPYVVLPFMKHGDLKSYISNKKTSLTAETLLDFGLQVADGMEYLSDKQYIHRDLAARNCMIDREFVVKVADFGFARDVFRCTDYSPADRNRPVPIKWMAIESLAEDIYTVYSDLWSYGVLLWELMSRGERPYPDVDMKLMLPYLRQGNRLSKPDLASEEVYFLMLECWNETPESRPSFTEIKQRLATILCTSEGSGRKSTGDPTYTTNTDDIRNNYIMDNYLRNNANSQSFNNQNDYTISYIRDMEDAQNREHNNYVNT